MLLLVLRILQTWTTWLTWFNLPLGSGFGFRLEQIFNAASAASKNDACIKSG